VKGLACNDSSSVTSIHVVANEKLKELCVKNLNYRSFRLKARRVFVSINLQGFVGKVVKPVFMKCAIFFYCKACIKIHQRHCSMFVHMNLSLHLSGGFFKVGKMDPGGSVGCGIQNEIAFND